MRETLTVLKKELLEIFRDESTFVILMIPIFVFPMLNMGLEFLSKEETSQISISINFDDEYAEDILNEFIDKNGKYEINVIKHDNAVELLKSGDIDCYIDINNNCYNFVYNSSSYNSLSLTTKLGEEFQKYYNLMMSEMDDNYYQVRLLNETNTVVNPTSSISGIFIPIVLILFVFQNTSSFANDIFAGEKERKTLELLLLSSVKKRNLYIGKSLALLIISILSLVFSLSTFFLSFYFSNQGLSQFKFIYEGNAVINILLLSFILILLSVISVFLSTTISLISKNMKNAQILNEIILAIPIGLTALLTLGIVKSEIKAFNYIPIANLISCFNSIFSGDIDIVNIAITLVSNFVFVWILILISVKYMNSEKIIR